MECDLVEVSGQMALPLPTQTAAPLSRTTRPWLFPRLRFLDLVTHALLWISNAAQRRSATGPGWFPLADGDSDARYGISSRRRKAR
jgi:hypothetical protein